MDMRRRIGKMAGITAHPRASKRESTAGRGCHTTMGGKPPAIPCCVLYWMIRLREEGFAVQTVERKKEGDAERAQPKIPSLKGIRRSTSPLSIWIAPRGPYVSLLFATHCLAVPGKNCTRAVKCPL